MIEKAINALIFLLVFLLPVFFLPITSEFYTFNKSALLILVTAILLVLWTLKMAIEKKVSFLKSPFNLPVILFASAYLISAFLSPNRFEVVFSPQGASTILALTFLYFIISNNIKMRLIPHLLTTLTLSGVVLALIAVYQFFGLGEALAPYPWLKIKTWTPAGGLLISSFFLGLILTILFVRIFKGRQSVSTTSINLIAAFIIIFGLGVSVYQLATVNKPVLLPLGFGWAIAIETLKQVRTALFGVGPGNFLTAFSLFRPLFYNGSSLWNVAFATSSNWYLNLLTEVGALGLAFYLLLIFAVVREILKRKVVLGQSLIGLSLSAALIFLILVEALLPTNILVLFSFFLLLGLLNLSFYQERYEEQSPLLAKIFFGASLALVLFSLFWQGKVYAAEFYFKKSLDAALQNRGGDTYNLQIKTVTLNPFFDQYRIAYSQTNLALANAISAKENLTDQDRATISRLIQQAIREGKAAVALNPTRASNWINLAVIYRNLINVARGSDQWAIVAYGRGISLDPVNPNLRINLGGVFYGLGNFEEATRHFQNAISLKPDFANAHYNLAAAYREQGNFQKAAQEMQTTLALVNPESEDYKKAKKELDDLMAKLPKEATVAASKREAPTTPQQELELPKAPPEGIKPPITLPPEAGPEVSPSPSPTLPPLPTITLPPPLPSP